MLKNSFCIFKNISFKREKEIWERGIKTWNEYVENKTEIKNDYLLKQVEEFSLLSER